MATKSKPNGTPREGVNTRLTADLRAKLASAAEAAGRSVGAEIEMRLLASFASDKPSLTAEDVRQIVREEMGQRTSGSAQAHSFFSGHLLELGTRLMDAPAWHVGPPVPPRFPDGGHVHIAADQGEGPFMPGAHAERQICRNRGCVKSDMPWMCGRHDCAQGL